MNIIEAIQKAEQGKLITNNFLKINNSFLMYIGHGLFEEFKTIDGEDKYVRDVTEFSIAHIISTGWSVLKK